MKDFLNLFFGILTGVILYSIVSVIIIQYRLDASYFYWGLLVYLIYPLIWRYHKHTSQRITDDLQLLENKIIETVKGIFYLIVGGVILWLVVWGGWKFIVWFGDFITPDTWTLMVCKTKMENGVECRDNAYTISDFSSKKECMLEGATRFSKQGFECGSNCHTEYSLNVCKEVCNSSGCSE